MSDQVYILVVDEDEANCKRVKACLEGQGYTVRRSDDGIDALVSIDSEHPALVLLEMEIPRLTGVELARAVKAHAETRSIPLIFLTDRADPRSMIEGINVGAKYYMTKPFEDDELIAKVKKAI